MDKLLCPKKQREMIPVSICSNFGAWTSKLLNFLKTLLFVLHHQNCFKCVYGPQRSLENHWEKHVSPQFILELKTEHKVLGSSEQDIITPF